MSTKIKKARHEMCNNHEMQVKCQILLIFITVMNNINTRKGIWFSASKL